MRALVVAALLSLATPARLASGYTEHVTFSFVAGEVAFKGATGLHLRVHLPLEEAVGTTPVAFGPVEGEVCIANDLLGARSVRRSAGVWRPGSRNGSMPLAWALCPRRCSSSSRC